MSILSPASQIERGQFNSAVAWRAGGLILGPSLYAECNGNKFFGQIKDIDIEYAELASVGPTKTPGRPNSIAMDTRLEAIQYALHHYVTIHWEDDEMFKDVVSPVFSSGSINTIDRETGGYSEYAGQGPSELTFSVKGFRPNVAVWYRNYAMNTKPMSLGVYLRNNDGDILGLMVGTVTNATLKPAAPTKYAFLPIPILGLRMAPSQLGGLENPDLMQFSILFPPFWDSPYQTGSTLDTYVASLQNITNRLGRIQYSALCLVPASLSEVPFP